MCLRCLALCLRVESFMFSFFISNFFFITEKVCFLTRTVYEMVDESKEGFKKFVPRNGTLLHFKASQVKVQRV